MRKMRKVGCWHIEGMRVSFDIPSQSRIVLAGTSLEDAMVEAMLKGGRAQRTARGVDTMVPREGLVRVDGLIS